MLKSKTALLSILLLCLSLIGCKQIDRIAQPSPLRIALPSWYDPKFVPAVAAVVDRWNLTHPTSGKAELQVLFGKREAILQKVILGAGRGDFADVALVRNEWIGALAADELIQPMPDPTASRVRQACLPGLIPAVTKDGRVWAVPFDADVFVTWVRRDMLANRGPGGLRWNATAFKMLAWEISSRLEGPDKRYGFAFPAARSPSSALVFLNWYLAHGGTFSLSDRGIDLDPKALVSAFEFLQVFVNQKSAPANVIALKQNDVFSGLAGGAYLMTAGGSWERSMLNRESKLSDRIVSYPIPSLIKDPGPSLLGGWSFVLLKKGSGEAPALLELFFSDETQRQKLADNSFLPVSTASLSDPWFETDRDGNVFRGALERGVAIPLSSDASGLLDRLAVALAEIFLNGQSPDLAAKKAINSR